MPAIYGHTGAAVKWIHEQGQTQWTAEGTPAHTECQVSLCIISVTITHCHLFTILPWWAAAQWLLSPILTENETLLIKKKKKGQCKDHWAWGDM